MKFSFTLNKWLSKMLNMEVFMTTVSSKTDIRKLKKASSQHTGIFWVGVPLEQQHFLNDLIRENFEWIDTYLEFSQKKAVPEAVKNSDITCRFAENKDQASLLAVGKSAFKTAGVYLGGLEQHEKLAQKLKKTWLQNFFQSHQGDALVVAEYKEKIVGFLQLSKTSNQWSIDILAVEKDAQKKGIATNLMLFVNQHFGLVVTTTNLANIKAIQFYEDCFFQLKRVHHLLVYSKTAK